MKYKNDRENIFVGFLILLLYGFVFLFIGIFTNSEIETNILLITRKSVFILMGIFFIIWDLSIGGSALLLLSSRIRSIEKLELTGIRGIAKIINYEEYGSGIFRDVMLELRVLLPGKDPIYIQKRTMIPINKILQVQLNNEIDVLIDPENPKNGSGLELVFK
jgi:hypothetical protein